LARGSASLLPKAPGIAVLLELRDDVIGDREPLLLGQWKEVL
jgi:hypothetical protein